MTKTYKSPDVYVEEISVFPPSVAEVGTAIPAFIGYTEKAKSNDANAAHDLLLKPTKIYSLNEFEQYFGRDPIEDLVVNVSLDSERAYRAALTTPASKRYVPTYLLYNAVKMYFDNGGGQCYIVSVNTYQTIPAVNPADLQAGLAVVALEDEPTLIVIPEAVNVGTNDYSDVVQAVLAQCATLGDRFGIFDIHGGNVALTAGGGGTLELARGYFGMNHLKYGATYYPFLGTSITFRVDETRVVVDGEGAGAMLDTLKDTATAVYNAAKAELKNHYLTMPPSGAIAGVYAATDSTRGVWKAPANVSLTDVIEPVVKITNAIQDDLNVDPTTGKSINAIRAFAGKGTLVWGARTLAGNDNEWRYISVRRFFNTAEESIKKATYWAVFEPNDANTWVKVRGMIENYLTDKWRDGALAGASPKDAFFVKCGLGTTMTSQDILEGRMNVEIGMAVVRPAEFIVLKFSHKLQTS